MGYYRRALTARCNHRVPALPSRRSISPSGATTPVTAAAAAVLRRELLSWYRRHRRDLPWRPTKARPANPYHVLVSEAMLQQTQVATVIAYFHRFIGHLPTIETLAAAPEREVLRLWQGLGYYRRARHLHAAARVIVERHDGRVPADVASLLALPGVGRYTAGAVASIAYGTPAPIVDGNVARVLARAFALDAPIDDPATRLTLWSLAESLLPRRGCGDFNQALMELGALVCAPRNPACAVCPWRASCAALRQGDVERLPRRTARREPRAVVHHIAAVRHGNHWLMEQRGPRGLWAGMWQFTTCESMSVPQTPLDIAAWLEKHTGISDAAVAHVKSFPHQTTHRAITFHLWTAVAEDRVPRPALALHRTWRRLDDLDDLPLPNPQRRAARLLLGR